MLETHYTFLIQKGYTDPTHLMSEKEVDEHDVKYGMLMH